jgi:D-alanyl-D-alanine carboxypeptidase
MIRRLAAMIAVLTTIILLAACKSEWYTLGTVDEIEWGSRSSRVFLTNGNAYRVDTLLLDDCHKGATLKVAGFLYSCW